MTNDEVLQCMLYLNYDTEREFMPQLEANTQQCILLLNDVPKLKEKLAHVG